MIEAIKAKLKEDLKCVNQIAGNHSLWDTLAGYNKKKSKKDLLEVIAIYNANRLALDIALRTLELVARPSLSRRATEEINIRQETACLAIEEIARELGG